MLRPTPLALTWGAALAGLAWLHGLLHALGWLGSSLLPLLWGLLVALALSLLIDALLVRRQPAPVVSRSLAPNLSLGQASEVGLWLNASGEQPLRARVIDHAPHGLGAGLPPAALVLRPGAAVRVSYTVCPAQRGLYTFERCELHVYSPLGLWTQRRYQPLAEHVRVLPDFARLHGARLRLVDAWLGQLGVRQQQRRGQGQAFHQLRDFRPGDALRQVDWKATARLRSPIVREYQDERDQHIILWLDCSRRMRSKDSERSHFDHALDASLLLAYVALRQGDAVGLQSFATAPRQLLPGKGQQQLAALLGSVYDLQASAEHADFPAAAATLLAGQKRRALVVLLTNLRDEDEETLLPALLQVKKQHRVLVASLREETLAQLTQPPHPPMGDTAAALGYCAAVQWLAGRQALNERLRNRGIAVLDVPPSDLAKALLDTYSAWKKAGTL